ncbi:MAG TPA: AAA family ATPase [Syntrophorhabdus aromaticivorans]|nr:AAA family ATPase [Syntrophorhabdus aromaticivorans]
MRIDRLKLVDFKNLKDFKIDFDESQPTTIVLGRNGSGKSNLIEALIEIFRDLEEGKVSGFPYEIEYLCHNHRIVVANDTKNKKRQGISVDGGGVSRSEFAAMLHEVLPKHIFAYYSGWNRRLETGFDRPTRKLYRDWLEHEDRDIPLRRLFYCRKEYSQLVLLGFFLSQSDSVKELLREYLSIDSFDSALFVLKKPYWRENKKPSDFERRTGDPRFWFARGAFKHFLDRLWKSALAPILLDESVDRDIRRPPQSTERLYLYIKNLDQLKELSGKDSPKEFFSLLESLFLCDLIDEVRVSVQHARAGRVRFEQLSEGEQQLLTVLGLMIFTQQDESLFLLDEPDTHLNPSWIYKYYDLLEENFPKTHSQLLIATHNPLMIGSLRKNQVRLLTDGTAVEPEDDPIGLSVDGLLQSELYGLRSTLPGEILEKLDARNELLAKDRRSHKEDAALRTLSDELARLGIALTHPNPYFDRFAKALARNPLFQKPELTQEESRRIAAETDSLLAEILREDQAK